MEEIEFRLTWKELSTGRLLKTYVSLDALLKQNEFTELTATKLIHNKDFELIAKEQFTELYDKNDKKIYKGDIVRVDGRKELYKVVFSDGGFMLNVIPDAHSQVFIRSEIIEIIGNELNNPELLK